MEDVITAIPPPSRFFLDDLNVFTSPPPPLPPPFLVVPEATSNTTPSQLRTSLLIIAISTSSLNLINHFPQKTLIATLVLPEVSHSSPSSSCHIYSIPNSDALIVALHYKISPERARAVAKTVMGRIVADRVVIFDGIHAGNFRGRVDVEEGMVFKLESEKERSAGESSSVKEVEYLPTGSVMDGVSAAVLAECQMRKVKGTIVATWPETGKFWSSYVSGKVRSILRDLIPGVDLDYAGVDIKVSSGGGDYSDLYI